MSNGAFRCGGSRPEDWIAESAENAGAISEKLNKATSNTADTRRIASIVQPE